MVARMSSRTNVRDLIISIAKSIAFLCSYVIMDLIQEVITAMLDFEWDEDKEAKNIKKHGIDFVSASHIFLDRNRIEYYDTQHSESEDRFITIGMVEEILTVVYTERKSTIRIISARLATKKEIKRYYYGDQKI